MRAMAVSHGAPVSAVPSFSLPRLQHCVQLLREAVPRLSLEQSIRRSFPLGCFLPVQEDSAESAHSTTGSKVFPLVAESFSSLFSGVNSTMSNDSPTTISLSSSGAKKMVDDCNLTPRQRQLANELLEDLGIGRGVCLLGSKGSGKSYIVSRVVSSYGGSDTPSAKTFPLYQVRLLYLLICYISRLNIVRMLVHRR
jgi:hypothetical protein